MTVKELKEQLNNIDDNTDIVFVVYDEYGTEVEGVKFRHLITNGYGDTYLTLSV